jgi:hypothetical protein
LLKKLYISKSTEAREFRQNIRAYNSSLAFASLGVHEHQLPSRGPYTFRIQGGIYHRIGHLLPDQDQLPKFSQLHIYDTTNEAKNRLSWNQSLSTTLITQLQTMLHQYNPFVAAYKQALDLIINEPHNNFQFVLRADPTTDLRRYNLPTASDICAIVPDSQSTPSSRDIVLYKRSSLHPQGHSILHINENHPHYDPLHYVLLLPHGQFGWTPNTLSSSGKKVTTMQYYGFHMMQRDGNFNVLLRAGRLFQQYIVDQYVKVEQERLNYIYYHQRELRAELYQGLQDAILSGDTDGNTIGRRIILPSSFTGGPRNTHQLYQDAMAIVRRFSKPDLFITFTCNPQLA